MLPQPVTVIVADDHPIIRDGILAILAATPHLRVVATVASFQELIALLPTVQADVVILDVIGMGGTPLTLVHRLTRDWPHLAIVVFSTSVDLAPELLQAGTRGYVVKEELPAQLVTAIETAHAGQTFISPIVQEYLHRCDVDPGQPRFTPKELSVLKLLAQGFGTTGIADQLGIDPRTVHNYVLKLYDKTGCEQRTQLAAWYQRVYGPPERM